MSNDQVRIWVNKKFAKKLKSEAALARKSILKHTKDLAQDCPEQSEKIKPKNTNYKRLRF